MDERGPELKGFANRVSDVAHWLRATNLLTRRRTPGGATLKSARSTRRVAPD